MPKVGVLLAGCGVQDGSEIYESVLTLLALEKAGATWMAMAPDVEQAHVVNHYTGEEDRQSTRRALTEAARIVRGKISSINEVSAHDIDALIIPGGYGVAKNLCTFATDGVEARVNPHAERLIQDLHGLGKPIGAICIAPILVALALPNQNLQMTVGDDATTSLALTRIGAQHHISKVDEIWVDEANNIVSTPAFMLAHSASEAEVGINKLVAQVLARIP
jgi:enhancing lycopene biosynthesis protein 2